MIKYFRQFKKWNSEPVPDDEWPSNEVREKPSEGFQMESFQMEKGFKWECCNEICIQKKEIILIAQQLIIRGE